MKIFPDKETFKRLAAEGNVVPVCTDLMADLETPVSVYAKLRARGPAFLLESVSGGERIGRYSFAGARPKQIITAWADRATITHRDGRIETLPTPADPLSLVEKVIAPCRVVQAASDMPPFFGGAIGFVSYEYTHCVEPTVPPAAKDELGTPLLHFLIMDSVVIFDHARQLIRICVNAFPNEARSPETAWEEAVVDLNVLFNILKTPRQLAPATLVEVAPTEPPNGNFTCEAFKNAVQKAREYIHAGDCVQVVLSQRFELPFSARALDIYRVLRHTNPSPYMFILESDAGFQLVGASPEVNVRLTGDAIEIRPIAGTRPRGATEDEDRQLEKELLADEKERAEHLMLVDLARNDIGRVSKIGTVRVTDYATIERYSHVMHIVSHVEGRIEDGKSAFDLFRSTFPAGTLSGAPKVRAMQIISELEETQRGPYGGALGYFSFSGNHDSCITIRSALLKDGKAFIQVGAGLVADSVPYAEYMETVNKSRNIVNAVAMAGEMQKQE
ncbi:MAG: anthranilate synthase component I [Puniceicoccales bacterium]|nr:anthranilate synthase component I [Puniceicoccales bacterium]